MSKKPKPHDETPAHDAPDDDSPEPAADAAEGSEPRTFTAEEVEARLAAAADEAKDNRLRLAAEYDNFRRRVAREKEQWSEEAIERFARDLLPVLDSFERALAAGGSAGDPVLEGLRVTDRQLRATLQRHGVETVDPAGAPFDPRLHEAILRTPADDVPPGTVLDVLEKGFTLKGRLLRPARVRVAGEA